MCVCVYVCICIKLQHCVYGMLRQTQRMDIEPILCVCVKLQTKTHCVNGPLVSYRCRKYITQQQIKLINYPLSQFVLRGEIEYIENSEQRFISCKMSQARCILHALNLILCGLNLISHKLISYVSSHKNSFHRIPNMKTVKNPSLVVLHCTFTMY